MKEIFKYYYDSPIGCIEVTGDDNYINSLYFIDEDRQNTGKLPDNINNSMKQLDEYFNNKRKKFSLPLRIDGTDFQKQVWNELLNIPFGNTTSYKDIAKKLNNIDAIRAVGAANGKNKISIFIPCHRVIGSDGSLTGYAGGLWRKQWLLNHESDSGLFNSKKNYSEKI